MNMYLQKKWGEKNQICADIWQTAGLTQICAVRIFVLLVLNQASISCKKRMSHLFPFLIFQSCPKILQGTVQRFYMRVYGIVSSSCKRFTFSVFFFHSVSYGQFNGVTDRSNRVTGNEWPFWTEFWYHWIDRSGHKDKTKRKYLKVNRSSELETVPYNPM